MSEGLDCCGAHPRDANATPDEELRALVDELTREPEEIDTQYAAGKGWAGERVRGLVEDYE